MLGGSVEKHQSGEPTLALRFIGGDLERRSMPVYELGDSLIALQRVVHKSYLFQNEKLKSRARLTRDERMRLALQVSERRKSSDLYQLVPFMSDPAAQDMLRTVLEVSLTALLTYAAQRVLPSEAARAKHEAEVRTGDVENSLFVGAIHAEVIQVTNHINNIGGVEAIQLIPGGGLESPTLTFDEGTREYVRSISNESYLGPQMEIVGYVTRLFPNRMVADIKVAPSRYVKVGLNEQDFAFIRYQTEQEQQLRFAGRPRIYLGKSELSFSEFEAESVRPL